MSSYYKPIDAKREEFRKYLERAGVMDAVTKALVSLYEEDEKPDDPLEYVIKSIGGATKEDIENAKAELTSYQEDIKDLEEEIASMKARQGMGGEEEEAEDEQ